MTSRIEWSHNGGVVTKLGGGRGYEFISKQLGLGYGGASLDAKVMEEEERRERRRRQKAKVVNCCKQFIAFLFSHIGLAGMVVAYSILGGFIFQALESPEEEKVKIEVIDFKKGLIDEIFLEAIKLHNGTSNRSDFQDSVGKIFVKFQEQVYVAVKDRGWDGRDEHDEADLQWSFAGALLFAVTVITTIGYGHIAPKTMWGRLVTILYALIGIPLTFLYLSNIGNFLADCFRLFYKKICCDICCCQKCERDKKRDRMRMMRLKLAQQRNMLLAQRFPLMAQTDPRRLQEPDNDSLCHSLDDDAAPHETCQRERANSTFHRSASAPRMLVNSLDAAVPPHRHGNQVGNNTGNVRATQHAATLPRRSSKLPSMSLEAPPPYNRPGNLSRPPSYRQSVTSTERLLPDTDVEMSASDLKHASSGNMRETAIIDSDSDEDKAKMTSLVSPSFSDGFFDRLGEAKETAIVDSDENRDSEIATNANMLSPPPKRGSKSSPSRSGSNRSERSAKSARSKSSYTDDIECISLIDDDTIVESRKSSSVSRRSRKEKEKEKYSKEKARKSKSKDKKKKDKGKDSIERSSSHSKSRRERSKSKSKESKSRKSKDDCKLSRKDTLALGGAEKSDLRKCSTQSEPSKLSRKNTRKDKSKPSFNRSTSSKSQKSSETACSSRHAEREDTPYRGSVESFVTAFSESSMCTQEDTDDEYTRNGDVIKKQPLSHGPAVSFGGNDDIAIEMGGREMNYRTLDHANQLHLSYLDDPLDFDDDEGEKVTVPISVCLIIIAGYIFAGSVLFTLWEDWDYLTGSYFCFITLSTIGFGDIVPGMKMNEWASRQKLVLCALWLAFGLSLLAMCFNLMQEEVKEKVKWVGTKIGLLKGEDQA